VLADLVRVLLAAALAVRHDSAPVAYAVAAGLSASQVFFNPAAQSLLPSLVEGRRARGGQQRHLDGRRHRAGPCRARRCPARRTGRLRARLRTERDELHPSAVLLRGLREPARTRPITVPSPFSHARDGLRALSQIPLLKALATGQFLAALSAGATSALLVLLAQDRLGGAGSFGILIAAIGIGAAPGPCCS
jgi:hypothetical protein